MGPCASFFFYYHFTSSWSSLVTSHSTNLHEPGPILLNSVSRASPAAAATHGGCRWHILQLFVSVTVCFIYVFCSFAQHRPPIAQNTTLAPFSTKKKTQKIISAPFLFCNLSKHKHCKNKYPQYQTLWQSLCRCLWILQWQ